MKTQIIDWAEKYVPEFNRLAKLHSAAFNTQSPLSEIGEGIETLIIGINPYGDSKVKDDINVSVEEFLKGNPTWANRFTDKDWISNKFYSGARWFMGYDKQRSSDAFDLDSKTVWTNLVPFQSQKGFNDLPPLYYEEQSALRQFLSAHFTPDSNWQLHFSTDNSIPGELALQFIGIKAVSV